MHACAHVHVCIEVRDYTGCLPLSIYTLSFETASLIELRTWQRLDWLASKLWGSSCLHPFSIIITDMNYRYDHIWFSCVCYRTKLWNSCFFGGYFTDWTFTQTPDICLLSYIKGSNTSNYKRQGQDKDYSRLLTMLWLFF